MKKTLYLKVEINAASECDPMQSLSDAATWAEVCLNGPDVKCDVTAYSKIADIGFDESSNRSDRINRRVNKLTSLGFDCHHEDSNVVHPKAPGTTFDFSATDEEFFVSRALEISFNSGRKQGANGVRKEFATMLEFED